MYKVEHLQNLQVLSVLCQFFRRDRSHCRTKYADGFAFVPSALVSLSHREILERSNMKKLGLYVHVPFCQKKCNYCDFYSCASKEKMSGYVSALITHIKNDAPFYKDYEIDSVFFGGGTPSLIEPSDFEKIAQALKDSFNFSNDCEFTIEANPGTITKEKLITYKNSGVNRLSIGLQTTFDDKLKELGRIHTYGEFVENFNLARACGFDNISVDVMYSLPNQTVDELLQTIVTVCDLSPEHISSYCLKIEEKTVFGKIKDSLSLPSEDTEYEMYISMCALLEKRGYMQYEISNFAKAGHESRHNLKYWQSEEYIGFGPSAHSYVNGKRYYYSPNLSSYINSVEQSKTVEKIYEDGENEQNLDEISKTDEYVMLKLRLSSGISEDEFFARFGMPLLEKYPKITAYLDSGYMKKSNGSYSFTPKGFFVSNYILTEILNFDN